MNKILFTLIILIFTYSCSSNTEKSRITEMLQEKIGDELPFDEVKIGSIENGIGVIIDGSWCYWIDQENKIYCVNGASKTIYNKINPECQDAPIKATFMDIEKIVK